LLAILCAGALSASTGCTSATTDPNGVSTIVGTPAYLGLIIRADTLFASVGCGIGPDNVSKYVAVVAGADGVDIDGRIYECFADANFFNLPVVNGSQKYTVRVFAYSQADYDNRREDIFAAERDHTKQAAQNPLYTATCEGDLIGVEGIAVCGSLVRAR